LGIETTAHDDDAFGGRGEMGVDGEREGDVGEGSGGVDGYLVGVAVHLAD
jgi:hypothetical protein